MVKRFTGFISLSVIEKQPGYIYDRIIGVMADKRSRYGSVFYYVNNNGIRKTCVIKNIKRNRLILEECYEMQLQIKTLEKKLGQIYKKLKYDKASDGYLYLHDGVLK